MNTSLSSQNRQTYIDIAKGLAIICVIFGHAGNDKLNPYLYSFHLPLFLLISGYFSKSNIPLKELIKKRFFQLIIPYLITATAIFLCFSFSPANENKTFPGMLLAVFYGVGDGKGAYLYGNTFHIESIGAIWFLPALFFAQLFWRLLVDRRYAFIWLCLLAVVGYYSIKHVRLPFSIQSGMFSAIFIYLGNLIRHHGGLAGLFDNKSLQTKQIIVITALIFWIRTIREFPKLYLVNLTIQEPIFNIIGSLCGSFIILLISRFINNHVVGIRAFFTWCGSSTLIVLCCHDFDMICLNPYSFCEQLGIVWSPWVITFRLVLDALLLTLIIQWIKKCIHYINNRCHC